MQRSRLIYYNLILHILFQKHHLYYPGPYIKDSLPKSPPKGSPVFRQLLSEIGVQGIMVWVRTEIKVVLLLGTSQARVQKMIE